MGKDQRTIKQQHIFQTTSKFKGADPNIKSDDCVPQISDEPIEKLELNGIESFVEKHNKDIVDDLLKKPKKKVECKKCKKAKSQTDKAKYFAKKRRGVKIKRVKKMSDKEISDFGKSIVNKGDKL